MYVQSINAKKIPVRPNDASRLPLPSPSLPSAMITVVGSRWRPLGCIVGSGDVAMVVAMVTVGSGGNVVMAVVTVGGGSGGHTRFFL